MTHLLVMVCLVGVSVPLVVAGQRPTIPETVAAHPDVKNFRMTHVEDYRVMTLQELAAKADLVVVGQLVRPRGYLSPEGYDIYTDYELIPSRVLIDRALAARSARPAATAMIVTVPGGQTSVNGSLVTVEDVRRVKWSDSADLLLFLSRDPKKKGAYELLGGPAGAFEVGPDKRLKSLKTGEKGDAIHGGRLDDIAQRVVAQQSR